MPSGGPASSELVFLGCSSHRTVAAVARAAAAWVILVVMAPSIGTVGVGSLPSVHSCGGISGADV
jgi:hypothetical protein